MPDVTMQDVRQDDGISREEAFPQVESWEGRSPGAAHSPVGYGRCRGCGQVKVLDERGRPFPHNRYGYRRRLRVQRCPGEHVPATPHPALAATG
jgi:hypothetical protein